MSKKNDNKVLVYGVFDKGKLIGKVWFTKEEQKLYDELNKKGIY
jgi:hypothetical protein